MNLESLKKAYADQGCRSLFVKRMAPNDNSKNQIYLGGDFTALNLFPFGAVESDDSEMAGSIRARLKANVKFAWLSGGDMKYNLVNLIMYPKYPEVRLSSLLKHKTASREISALVNSRDEGRLLFLGVNNFGGVIGYCSGKEDVVTKEFNYQDEVQQFPQQGVFSSLSLQSKFTVDPVSVISAALLPIIKRGWIESYRLDRNGNRKRCVASNCGGYTLEAALGIIPNGISEPDYEGWEVKQYGVGKFESRASKSITLMTPEPDGGYYKDIGVIDFLNRFGYPDRKSPRDRRNFGGVHKVGNVNRSTGLGLELYGYDPRSPSKWDANGAIQLCDDNGIAASWSFAGLLAHWQRKHAQAVYLRSIVEETPLRRYRYGGDIQLGQGTNFSKFLQAFSNGGIFYDPGIKMEGIHEGKIRTKRRSQFRIKSNNLRQLYKDFSSVNLLE